MKFIVRGVVYGFAFSLGAALFKKVQARLGLAEEPGNDSASKVTPQDGMTDPGLRHEFS
jgi:hypothetical protein